ncbi:MAG: ATP-binding cassette domain-containing protein [Deltaproteobacteria bacterium]|nr:ATP-binding cassette domain-containing protein [Deltaproteobacteria bacterium]
MSLIALKDITKFYSQQDVLKSANFQISAGERVGLIGPNGAGKTTLFRLILGLESAQSGEIHKSKSLRIGYLPQDILTFSGKTVLTLVMDTAEEARAVENELEEVAREIEEKSKAAFLDEASLLELTRRQSHLFELFEVLGGYQLESRAGKILEGLGFHTADFGRQVDELSGGWIMRAALARLLLSEPDILLLDEPTNHLDMESLLWLENYLKQCPSALLLISHDRTFLNTVVHRIVEIDRAEITNYACGFDEYLVEREKRLTVQAAAYANQQERIKQIERFIERGRVRKSSARRVQSRVKTLEKIERIDAPATRSKTIKLVLPPGARPPQTLIKLSKVSKSYGQNTIYRDLDFSIHRGDKIAFLGVNGAGKTTLMKILAGVTEFEAGKREVGPNTILSYFAQHQLEELNENLTVLEELSSVAPDQAVGRLRTILGSFLFREEDVFKKVAVLSGGEKTRLILAKIMLTGPNLLLLDEPSNHLDIPGRDMLKQALKQFQGCICFISHDRSLINSIANKIVLARNGKLEIFPGNFDDFYRIWEDRLKLDFNQKVPGVEAEKAPTARLSRAEREARKRMEAEYRQRLYTKKAPLEKELRNLESNLTDVGERLDSLDHELSKPEAYQSPEKSKELNQEYSQLKAKSEELTAAWEDILGKLTAIEENIEQSEGRVD